jgi:putative FmdB family regulatory protein
MPLYEYQCDACGHRFEKIQKFSDPLIDECPKCGERQVHKLVSSPAIQFKGTGWYITDYAKKNTVDGAKGESKDGDAKGADSKTSDANSSAKADGKTGDSKPTESKGSESKSAETKASDAKPVSTSSS